MDKSQIANFLDDNGVRPSLAMQVADIYIDPLIMQAFCDMHSLTEGGNSYTDLQEEILSLKEALSEIKKVASTYLAASKRAAKLDPDNEDLAVVADSESLEEINDLAEYVLSPM